MFDTPPKVAAALASVAVAIGFADLPYGYYILLRWILCGISLFLLFGAELTLPDWARWTLGGFAVLYNPVLPIVLGEKTIWQVLNVLTVGVFWLSAFHARAPVLQTTVQHRGPHKEGLEDLKEGGVNAGHEPEYVGSPASDYTKGCVCADSDPLDFWRAQRHLQNASDSGVPQAHARLALLYAKRRMFDGALLEWRLLWQNSSRPAMDEGLVGFQYLQCVQMGMPHDGEVELCQRRKKVEAFIDRAAADASDEDAAYYAQCKTLLAALTAGGGSART